MKFCFVDESGGGEAPETGPSATPVLAIAGLIVGADEVPSMTRDFVSLKCRHFATKMVTGGRSLDQILTEVKGTQLLSLHRHSGRNKRRQAMKFLDELLTILEDHDVRLMGRIWVKKPGETINVKTRYGYAMQDFALHFDRYLGETDEDGIIVADSREHKLNLQVAHSVFTQKWRAGGDAYKHVREVPLFAASDNHAGLQLADHVATTVWFPMATAAYGLAFPHSVHTPAAYEPIRQRFADRVRGLTLRVQTSDMIANRSTNQLLELN